MFKFFSTTSHRYERVHNNVKIASEFTTTFSGPKTTREISLWFGNQCPFVDEDPTTVAVAVQALLRALLYGSPDMDYHALNAVNEALEEIAEYGAPIPKEQPDISAFDTATYDGPIAGDS